MRPIIFLILFLFGCYRDVIPVNCDNEYSRCIQNCALFKKEDEAVNCSQICQDRYDICNEEGRW